ncbi:hypothetical protein [Micromonospora narathiwatensis]|uniref:hypothetical protein n=1 Tax=Micromonospora narathiwatensis TaxID=299146 RepID=UPI000B89230B|nr:hypothetical protein [Micromonospora narathiwatensis]
MDTAALWSAIGTVATAVAGLSALVVAYLAYLATRGAAESAAAMTRIEARRDWADMIPQFEVSIQAQSDLYALMHVELLGPLRLDRLDEIQLSIRDDYHARGASPLAGGPDAEQVANHVWGPYRFRHGIDGGSENGRTVAPFQLPMGEGMKFAMDRQNPPPWNRSGTEASWRRDYEGKPVRLLLKCRREGFEAWSVPLEVFVTPLPQPEIPKQAAPAEENQAFG